MLDASCGTCSHLTILEKSFTCVGSDISKDMIEAGKHKLKSKLFVKDIKKLDFDEKFDVILSLYDSLNNLTLDELEDAFRSIYEQLSNGGILIFDLLTLKSMKEMNNYQIQAGHVEDYSYIWENLYTTGIWHWTFTTFIPKDNSNYEKHVEEHKEYFHSIDDVKILLKKIGFDLIDFHDTYTMEKVNDESIDISLDTIKICKQALIFVNSKRSAESVAEKISKQVKDIKLINLSEQILHALSKPTKQCERLSRCVLKGIAFHHAGLNYKQREIIEDHFRSGEIKVIVATPTLAYGLDMPAFRAIIRDLKRYGGRWGQQPIPVLEYLQMAGRAGRPGKEDYGEAICLAGNETEEKAIKDTFIDGEPEDIFSKLAAEPVLRTYVLSLISTEFCLTKESLYNFFSKTFYAHQYGEIEGIISLINKILLKLEEWEFIEGEISEFKSADDVGKLKSTKLGKRVAELYLDPLTANQIITGLRRSTGVDPDEFSFIHLACSTLELRPLFKAKAKDNEFLQEKINEYEDNLLIEEPSLYDDAYDEFLDSVKTSVVFDEWMEEIDERELLEKFDVRPGEFNVKLERIDWILYCMEEFSRMVRFNKIISLIKKTRFRLKNGVREELVTLLKLKNIGRVRARKMFNNGIKDIGEVKKVPFETLAQLIGKGTAKDIKEQVGEKVDVQVKENKRKGQISLNDF